MGAVVSHGESLCGTLGFVVDTAWPDRIDVAPVGFGLGMDQGIAVDLGGGGEQEAGLLGPGQPEHVVGAQRPHLEGVNGVTLVIDRRGW